VDCNSNTTAIGECENLITVVLAWILVLSFCCVQIHVVLVMVISAIGFGI